MNSNLVEGQPYGWVVVAVATLCLALGFGAERIEFIGALVISTFIMSLSQQSEPWVVYAIYFAIGGLGFACLFTPLLALVGLWFDRRKGLLIGIVTAGAGQGVAPVVIQLASRRRRCSGSPRRSRCSHCM